mmetsp:Transcript_19626/g.31977  ORF Transcript_19626/g.31977 Transcript_19626/m.31977 type:complete len:211 (+) Transcript_19626:310-942(+)
MFDEYKIESKNNNIIGLAIRASNLIASIRTGKRSQRIVVKLSKKDRQPCLKIEMVMDNNEITQDVPVTLLNKRQIQETAEPSLPDPEVKIQLPETLKNVISNMKSVSDDVLLSATSSGDMSVQVSAELVTIKTYFKELKGFESTEDATSGIETGRCRMNIRKLSQVLNSKIVNLSNYIVGCIVESHAFVVYVELGQNMGHATFYLPVLTV